MLLIISFKKIFCISFYMSLNGSWIRGSEDHFWTLGCCNVCSLPEKKEGCWCSHVKCHECEWYEGKTIENEEHEDLTHSMGKCISSKRRNSKRM